MIFNIAYANEVPAAGSPWSSFIVMAIIFGIFYFLILRPAQAKAKKEQAVINELKKGDEVYTRSGMIGKIHGLTDKVVTLEVSEGVKIKVVRNQIGGLFNSLTTEKKAESKK